MLEANKAVVRTFFDAVMAGELPDSLLTADMTAWTTMAGTTDKSSYQGMIRMLARMTSPALTFSIQSLTAEEDRVVAEVESEGTLIDGQGYHNTYVFVFRIRDGFIASVAEHFNAVIVSKTLVPLMARMAGEDAS